MGTDIYLHAERRSGGAWQYCGELDDLESRNRQFFAILANVRNRSTDPFDYIVSPRGFPDDMSEELRQQGLLFCGHDPGWVTLRELLDFDWDKPLKTMQKFSKTVYSDAKSGTGARVKWVNTYKEAVGSIYLNELFTTLAAFGSPEDVRIVFSFDT